MLYKRNEIKELKCKLLDQLKEEHAFWSYEPASVSLDNIDDDQLIAYTMRYLDLKEIELLFKMFSYDKIKRAWKMLLVPEG